MHVLHHHGKQGAGVAAQTAALLLCLGVFAQTAAAQSPTFQSWWSRTGRPYSIEMTWTGNVRIFPSLPEREWRHLNGHVGMSWRFDPVRHDQLHRTEASRSTRPMSFLLADLRVGPIDRIRQKRRDYGPFTVNAEAYVLVSKTAAMGGAVYASEVGYDRLFGSDTVLSSQNAAGPALALFLGPDLAMTHSIAFGESEAGGGTGERQFTVIWGHTLVARLERRLGLRLRGLLHYAGELARGGRLDAELEYAPHPYASLIGGLEAATARSTRMSPRQTVQGYAGFRVIAFTRLVLHSRIGYETDIGTRGLSSVTGDASIGLRF